MGDGAQDADLERLARALLAGAASAEAEAPPAAVSAALGRALQAARAAWPGISVEPERLVEHLAPHLAGDAGGLAARLEALHAADLYLACAALLGNPAALKALDERFLAAV